VSLSSRASSYTEVQPPQTDHPPGLFREPACPGFYRRIGKRAVDICGSLLALITFSPLFLVLAILINLTSRGPVFYRQNRVGRDARIFRILKFRSMVEDADRQGPGITAAEDERVTPFGKFLRELKLDETPQFWNVLKGDMSLVGPRPELPSYVAHYTPEQLGVLSVKPGITDIASIRYRHEEKLLKRSADPDELYRHLILPEKLALNLQYIHRMSLALDLKLILETLRSIAL